MEEDFMSDFIAEQCKLLRAEQERLLKERLFKLLGYELDIMAEQRRRFPRLVKKVNIAEHSEYYYWNDGSASGQLVISFFVLPISFSLAHSMKDPFFVTGFKYE